MFCRSVEEAYFRSVTGSILPAIARTSGYPLTSEAALTRVIFDTVTRPLTNVAISDLEDAQLTEAIMIAERLATGDVAYAQTITSQSRSSRRRGHLSRV